MGSGTSPGTATPVESGLLVTTDGPVRTLMLNRPAVRNALTVPLRLDLDRQLALADEDPDVRVVVVKGADGHFCSGADINEMNRGLDADAAHEYLDKVAQPVFRRVRELRTPSIAQVDGVAAGAGMFLALGCDIVVASTRARFVASHLRIGVPPDWGGIWLLPRMVGVARAKALLMTGRAIDAEQALSWGMVADVAEPVDMDRIVRGYCDDLQRAPRLALGLTRRALDRSLDTDLQPYLDWEASTASLMLLTDEHHERVHAFLDAKRKNPGSTPEGTTHARTEA